MLILVTRLHLLDDVRSGLGNYLVVYEGDRLEAAGPFLRLKSLGLMLRRRLW